MKSPQQKHLDHQVVIAPGSGPHAYQLRCTECDAHIQWLSQVQAEYLVEEMGWRSEQD